MIDVCGIPDQRPRLLCLLVVAVVCFDNFPTVKTKAPFFIIAHLRSKNAEHKCFIAVFKHVPGLFRVCGEYEALMCELVLRLCAVNISIFPLIFPPVPHKRRCSTQRADQSLAADRASWEI